MVNRVLKCDSIIDLFNPTKSPTQKNAMVWWVDGGSFHCKTSLTPVLLLSTYLLLLASVGLKVFYAQTMCHFVSFALFLFSPLFFWRIIGKECSSNLYTALLENLFMILGLSIKFISKFQLKIRKLLSTFVTFLRKFLSPKIKRLIIN